MMEQLRTDSSRHWHVSGQGFPTSVTVQRATQSGAPSKTSATWEACALCFTRSGGREVPPILNGACTNCGYVHDQQGFQDDAHVTSEKRDKPLVRGPRSKR